MSHQEPADVREQLVAELRDVLSAAVGEHGDPRRVLADDVVRLAQALAAMVVDGDIGAWYLVATVHWFRYRLLPVGRDREDLAAAINAFAKVLPHAPDAVPEPIRQLLAGDPGMVVEDDGVQQHSAAKLTIQALRLLRDPRTAGDVTALGQAIDWLEHALALTPTDHPDRAGRLSNLGNALRTRFERVGAIADLDQAITIHQQAVDATPPNHPDRAGRLSNLCGALLTRFERVGAIADLDQAIRVGQEAVDVSPRNHPALPMFLSNLGIALYTRFGRLGAIIDLERAITLGREAVDAIALDHPDRPVYLSNLGVTLRTRSEHVGAITDLDEAITVHQQAVDATAPGQPDRAMYLSNLGLALHTRFERVGAITDLDQAITVHQQAIAATAPDHANRARYLTNLGNALRTRYERVGAITDLDQAITVHQQAIDATAPDHPDRAMYLSNLGVALRTRFARTANVADRDRAAAALQAALRQVTAAPMVRARTGRAAAVLAADQSDWATAETALTTVLDLLPTLTDHSLDLPDRQHHLTQLQGLAADTARASIGPVTRDHTWNSRVTTAWRRLEQARNVLLTQALETRYTLDLPPSHHHLAAEYDQLRELLTGVKGTPMVDHVDPAAAARRAEQEMIAQRKAAAERWPKLLEEIRQVPGFEHFALPPPIEALREAAGDGTVVAITVTNHGCGALTLTHDHVDYIELPDLTAQAALDNANAFLNALYPPPEQTVDATTLTRVLAWLWDTVTGPILDQLGHRSAPADVDSPQAWPRVWWIPTGALTVLPLHAAGHHNDPPDTRRAVLDRVVSSYTPSVRALSDARQRVQAGMGRSGLAVGIDQTADPSHDALSMAESEATKVATKINIWLGATQPPLLGQDATHAAVTAALPKASWAHLSCHGLVDNQDPAQSYLALYDKPLKANELFTMHLDNPYLAYLSACSTAVGSLGLLDENIHLASAFQLAGFPHVIATLWPVLDNLSAHLAEDIYTAIHPDPHTWNPPAWALHATVRAYRARFLSNPHVWASHIHLGP